MTQRDPHTPAAGDHVSTEHDVYEIRYWPSVESETYLTVGMSWSTEYTRASAEDEMRKCAQHYPIVKIRGRDISPWQDVAELRSSADGTTTSNEEQ